MENILVEGSKGPLCWVHIGYATCVLARENRYIDYNTTVLSAVVPSTTNHAGVNPKKRNLRLWDCQIFSFQFLSVSILKQFKDGTVKYNIIKRSKGKNMHEKRRHQIHFPHYSVQTLIFGSWLCFRLICDFCITKQHSEKLNSFILFFIKECFFLQISSVRNNIYKTFHVFSLM